MTGGWGSMLGRKLLLPPRGRCDPLVFKNPHRLRCELNVTEIFVYLAFKPWSWAEKRSLKSQLTIWLHLDPCPDGSSSAFRSQASGQNWSPFRREREAQWLVAWKHDKNSAAVEKIPAADFFRHQVLEGSWARAIWRPQSACVLKIWKNNLEAENLVGPTVLTTWRHSCVF